MPKHAYRQAVADALVQVKVTKAERAAICLAADLTGVTVSRFMRFYVRQGAILTLKQAGREVAFLEEEAKAAARKKNAP